MRGARAVVKDVAEVGIGGFGAHFGPLHKGGSVGFLGDLVFLDWLGKAWPAGAGIEFIQRTEQRFAGNNIHINTGLMIVPICVLERRFRAALLGDAKLQWVEL